MKLIAHENKRIFISLIFIILFIFDDFQFALAFKTLNKNNNKNNLKNKNKNNIKSLSKTNTNSNLKSNFAQVEDPNTLPQNSNTSTSSSENLQNNKAEFNVNTAVRLFSQCFKILKKKKNDKGTIYDQCIDNTITVKAISPLRKLWDYLDTLDFTANEDIVKEPFNTFCEEAMSEEKLIVDKISFNCDEICKEVSVDDIEENTEQDLKEVLRPYFITPRFGGKKKNIITAFISTYRDTELGRALPRKLNRLG